MEINKKDSLNVTNYSVCNHYAGNTKFAEKAIKLQNELNGAFEITLDLEDGSENFSGLSLAEDFLEIIKSPKNIYKKIGIRLPDNSHPDFRALASLFLGKENSKIAHLTIPKIKSFSQFNKVKASLLGLLPNYSKKLPPLRILIEDISVLSDIEQISKDVDVETLELGLMDFISSFNALIPMNECKDLNEFSNPLINYYKSLLSITATKNNKTPVHNVCREYKDSSKIEEFCIKAKKLGFGKMWSIHPAQIEIILKVLTPSSDELKEANEILQLAKEKNWAPISFENTLHDMASYRYYQSLLKRAKLLGQKLPIEADSLGLDI